MLIKPEEAKARAKPSCKHCHGTGAVGVDSRTKRPIACICVSKELQREHAQLEAEAAKEARQKLGVAKPEAEVASSEPTINPNVARIDRVNRLQKEIAQLEEAERKELAKLKEEPIPSLDSKIALVEAEGANGQAAIANLENLIASTREAIAVANVNIKHWEELIHAGRSNIASWQQDIARTSAEADIKRKEQKPSMNKLASLKAERNKKAHQITHRANVIGERAAKLQERLNKIQATKG